MSPERRQIGISLTAPHHCFMYKLNNSVILMDIHTIKHNKYYRLNANSIKQFGIVVNICTFTCILHSFMILPVVEGPRGRVARIGGIW
jgi:hypothetical protein